MMPPIGLRQSDLFFESVARIAGAPVPERHLEERGRLIDAMVDAHKYTFGVRGIVYGEPGMVISMASFLADAGAVPVICAVTGGDEDTLAAVNTVTSECKEKPVVLIDTDFDEIRRYAIEARADLLIGSSKGNHIARELGISLIRTGFPVHDRFGAQRELQLGYRGALSLLDLLTNTIISRDEDRLGRGYSYM
jgi:nitrogenase molybdenum-iron protein NifN